MKKCWYRLKLNVENAISKDWKFPESNAFWRGLGVWSFKKDAIFSDEWINYMNDVAVPINRSLVFYREPNKVDTVAHVDLVSDIDTTTPTTTHFSFNWVFGGAGSEMIWYDMPPGEHAFEIAPGNNKILTWPITDLVEIDRCAIQNEPTLVRTDLPHSIAVGNEVRWCISARSSIHALTWDDAIEHLKAKNIIIDR